METHGLEPLKRIESKFTPENYHLAFFLRFFLCCPLQYFSFVAHRSFITHQPSAKSNIHKEWPYCFNDSLCYALLLSRRVEGSFYHFWHFFYQSSYHYVYFYVVGTLKTGVFLSLVPRKELIKSLEEIGKVYKPFLPCDRKLIHRRILSCPNWPINSSIFALSCLPKAANFTKKEVS